MGTDCYMASFRDIATIKKMDVNTSLYYLEQQIKNLLQAINKAISFALDNSEWSPGCYDYHGLKLDFHIYKQVSDKINEARSLLLLVKEKE